MVGNNTTTPRLWAGRLSYYACAESVVNIAVRD